MLYKQYYIGIGTSPEYIKLSKHRIIEYIGSTDTDKDKQSKDKEDTQCLFDNV